MGLTTTTTTTTTAAILCCAALLALADGCTPYVRRSGTSAYTCIANGWPARVPRTATDLTLLGRSITHLRPSDFAQYHYKTLAVRGTAVSFFPAHLLQGQTQLTRLEISYQPLEVHLMRGFFDSMPNLSELDMAGTRVSNVSIFELARVHSRLTVATYEHGVRRSILHALGRSIDKRAIASAQPATTPPQATAQVFTNRETFSDAAMAEINKQTRREIAIVWAPASLFTVVVVVMAAALARRALLKKSTKHSTDQATVHTIRSQSPSFTRKHEDRIWHSVPSKPLDERRRLDCAANFSCMPKMGTNVKSTRTMLPIFIVFLTNTLDWCLISVLTPAAPGYLGLESLKEGAISKLGVVIGANAGVQLITTVFVGRFVDRFGSAAPFSIGLIIMLTSTLIMAFAADISWTHRYWIVLGSRIMQGFSSGLASTAGMAWLMSLFTDQIQRSRAIGIAVTGVGLGVIVGMPLGSWLTTLGIVQGWRVQFLILDALLLVNIVLLFYSLGSKMPTFENKEDGLGWRVVLRLATDPYIFQVFFLCLLLNVGMSAMEATLPSWVRLVLNAPRWSLGLFFIACHIPYTILAPLCSQMFYRIGRHWALGLGSLLLGFGMFLIPFFIYYIYGYSSSPFFVCAPLVVVGSGLGLFDAASMPFVADIVEKRHANLLGSACAVINSSWALGFFLGPVVANILVDHIGYQWVYVIIGQMILLSGFTAFRLSEVPGKDEPQKKKK